MLPTEQTKVSTAITGPMKAPHTAWTRAEESVEEQAVEEVVAELRDEARPSRNPMVISFHSICQSPRKLCATSDQADAEVSRSRHVIDSPAM